MGYFSLLQELEESKAKQGAEAKERLDDIGGDWALLQDLAWSRTEDAQFVRNLYEELAKNDRTIALRLTRIARAGRGSGDIIRAQMEEGIEPVAPYLVSLLGTGEKVRALQLLSHVYDRVGRPIRQLREIAKGDGRESAWAWATLASSPYEDDRNFVFGALGSSGPLDELEVPLRCRMAGAGDKRNDDWIADYLKRASHEWTQAAARAVEAGEKRHLRREDHSPTADVIVQAGNRRVRAAVEPLVTLLHSFDGLEALQALGKIGDGSATPAVREFLDMLAGDAKAVAPFKLTAQNALSALGRPQPVDTARWVFEHYHPRRYGYPKMNDVIMLQIVAARALLNRGSDTDWQFIANLIDAPIAGLRDIGVQAFERLSRTKPTLAYYDGPRVEEILEHEGADVLFDALETPNIVFKHNVAKALLAHDDADVRARATAWCRTRLEAQPNYFCESAEGTGPESEELVRALRDLDEGELTTAMDGTTSAWIRSFVLDGDDMQRVAPAAELGVKVSVEPFDRVPFVFGAHVNGLALSADGKQLAVVGSNLGTIVDADSGAIAAQLELRWNWGYDCVFTADGKTLAACFHGGHVETYDVASGARKLSFAGHRGVPNGTKRVALSPDDRTLVSAGQDGRVIAFDLETGKQKWQHQASRGSYEALTFSPAGDKIVAAHVKTSGGEENFLTVHDSITGEAERHNTVNSIWALAFTADGERIAMGGEAGDVLVCNAEFDVVQRLKLAQTTRLVFSDNGVNLYGASADGLLKKWDLTDTEDLEGTTLLDGSDGPIWGLQLGHNGILVAIGTSGTLHRFTSAGEELTSEASGVHSKQVRLMRRFENEIYTGGWDGKLLRWQPDGGSGEIVFEIDRRINGGQLIPDGRAALATGRGVRVVRLADGEVLGEREGDLDAVAVSDDLRYVAVDSRESLQLLDLDKLEPIGDTIVVGTDSISSIIAMPGGAWLVGTDAGEVSLVKKVGGRRWTINHHGTDRLERGTPHKDICDLLLTRDGYISSGNDNVTRVYTWDEDGQPVQDKRIHTYSGIFNRLGLSPDGRLLASPSSSALSVFALPSGGRILHLPAEKYFQRQAPTSCLFLSNQQLLVGTENGRIFRATLEGAPE